MGNGANPRSFHGCGNDGKGSHGDGSVSDNLEKIEAGKKPASTFRLSWRAFAALWIKRFGGFVGQQGIEDKREKFSGTRPPLKDPLRRRL